ncbi:ABC transporter substrate-binding protein [Chloroflexota bacterium]
MKNKSGKPIAICLILTISLILLTSCTPLPESTLPSSIQITDQMGRIVVLETAPQKIISLAPSNTEILFALGLAEQIAAVTDYCDYPPEAEFKPSIGGFSTPNIEEIIALSPDLILATSKHENKIIPQLEDKGLTVIALNPKTIDKVLEAITIVGKVCGVKEAAANLVAEMQQRIKAVTDKTSGLSPEEILKTYYVVWFGDEGVMIAGSSTLQNEMIAMAGSHNAGSEIESYANVDIETVIFRDPAVMIVGTSHGSAGLDTYNYVYNEPRLGDISARKNNHVYAIDSNIASRPGPRIIEALELFAQSIHPELFK